jgi:hypothetical protein
MTPCDYACNGARRSCRQDRVQLLCLPPTPPLLGGHSRSRQGYAELALAQPALDFLGCLARNLCTIEPWHVCVSCTAGVAKTDFDPTHENSESSLKNEFSRIHAIARQL